MICPLRAVHEHFNNEKYGKPFDYLTKGDMECLTFWELTDCSPSHHSVGHLFVEVPSTLQVSTGPELHEHLPGAF